MADDLSGSRRLKALLASLDKKTVSTGWFETDRYEADPARNRKGGMPVALVAFWLDNGTTNMPARPFFREAVASSLSEIKQLIKRNVGLVSQDKMTPDEALMQVGLFLEGKIIDNIKSQRFAPLSERHLEWKKQFHSNPQMLIDTGKLWQSLKSKVEEAE